jgi:hypothetical protein
MADAEAQYIHRLSSMKALVRLWLAQNERRIPVDRTPLAALSTSNMGASRRAL